MSIRIRTGYAFHKAAGQLSVIAGILQQHGRTHAPITDTASAYGWVQWDGIVRKLGMLPAFGVELAVSQDITAKRPVVDYWTFIAKDDLRPLHQIISVATEQFRYEPLLTLEQAARAAESLNVVMGHRSPVEVIGPRSGLWFALSPAVSPGQLKRVLKTGHCIVAACDNRFPGKDDRGLYEMACGKRSDTQSYPQWIMSDDEWRASVSHFDLFQMNLDAALQRRDAILQQSTATLQRAEMAHPPRPLSLLVMCFAGVERLGIDLMNETYLNRLNHELDLIKQKGFEDYFHMVADIVAFARQRMMVGPARGSSCGSLVCYLLGITTIDPIPHGLLFERFIDVNRADLPDIDIDFSEQNRNLIFDYVRKKYGPHRVARLGTVNMFQVRSALRAAAIALKIPEWAVEGIADQAEKSSIEEALKNNVLNRKYPELAVAAKLIDHPSHAGQHPGGVVITNGPVSDTVAIDQRSGATMCDYRDAEKLNLLKIDMLGLTQLSVFEDALQLASLPRDTLSKVPFDDVKAFHILNTRRYAGIFQFNGGALQQLTSKVLVHAFEDMVALTALARPGPMQSGEDKRWLRIRGNQEVASYLHPLFEPILQPTLGVVIYQEQIMQICRAVGMEWPDVSALRRLISKSAGPEEMDKFLQTFSKCCKQHGMTDSTIEHTWNVLRESGAYSFNKSHAVAYAVVSYWCCWLKAHHQLEFAAATLSHTSEENQIKLLRELEKEGIRYVPADRQVSTDKWTVGNVDGQKKLVGPLSNIIGIGPKHQSTILSQRARPMEQLPDHVGKLLARMKTKIDNLYPIRSALNALMPDPKKLNIVSTPSEIGAVQTNGEKYTVLVIGRVNELREKPANGAMSLNMRIEDDTGEILAKVSRYEFDPMGKKIIAHGKGYYALRGMVPADFRMIWVEGFRFIGAENENHKSE